MCLYKYTVYAGPGSCMSATSQWVFCFKYHDATYEYKQFNHKIYSKNGKMFVARRGTEFSSLTGKGMNISTMSFKASY